MKKIFIFLFLCFIGLVASAQITVNQGFENSILPLGWTSSIGSGTYNWIVATSGSTPSCSPHLGLYMMEYQSFSQASGGNAILISPVIDWSARSGVATTVKIWYYRDCTADNSSAYSLEGVTVYINTTNSLSGSPVSMGFVPRAGSQSITGSVTGTATTTTTGWYQYTFTVPSTFNSATNYLIFKTFSQNGDNQFMDDVSYTSYPCLIAAISGYSGPVCSGSAITLADATTGGTWSSGNTSVATIGSATGIMNGVSAGTAVISYTASCGASVTITVSVLTSPTASSGNTPVCQGNTIALTNGAGTGTWSSGTSSIATVNSTSGVVSAISAGAALITFTLTTTGCTNAVTVTVNTAPLAITGGLTVCTGSSSPLFSSPAGGIWTSSNSLLATVGSLSGTVIATAPGNPLIIYTLPNSCFANSLLTVNPQPGAITGTAAFCGTQTTTLSALPSGGTWSSSNTSVATASSISGIITGISGGGNAIITYTLPAGCSSSRSVTVNPLAAITGVSGTCSGATTILGNILPGGIWSSSNTAIATIGSASGILTGVASGTSTVSYLLPVTGCITTISKTITVSPAIYVANGGGAFCLGGTGVHIGLANSTIGFNYQLSAGGILTGSSIPGTGTVLDFGLTTTPGTYAIVANPGTSCATNMAGILSVSNNPLPTVYNLLGGGNYCAGGSGLSIYMSGSNTGISYQLFNSIFAAGSPVTGTTSVIDFGLKTINGTYSVVATNIVTGCTNSMTGSPIILTNPIPAVFTLTGGGSYCAGGAGVPVGLANSATGVNYQLFRSGLPVGAIFPGTGSPISLGIQAIPGNYTISATNPATGCIANIPGSAIVGVNPLPSLFPVTGGGAYCAGGAGVHIGLGGSSAGVNYQMMFGGSPTGAIVAGTGSALDLGLVTIAGAYTVSATNTATLCTSTMIGSVSVIISPLPVVFTVAGGGGYCLGGGGVHIILSGSQPATNYYLYNGTVLAGGASGTGTSIDFGLKSSSGAYSATGILLPTGCSVNMAGSAAVAINSVTVYTVTGGGSFCSGSLAPHVLLSGSDAGISYQLLKNGSPVGVAVTGTGTGLDFGAQAIAATYTIKATNTATGCIINMVGNAIITVNSIPSNYSLTGGGNYCSGGTGVHIGLAGSASGTSYSLNRAGVAVGAPVSGSGTALDFGIQTAGGTYTVIATNLTSLCTSTMPGSTGITINSIPVAYLVTGGGNYCPGGIGTHIGLNNSNTGVSYQLYNGALAIGAGIPGTGSGLDFGLKTTTGTYTVLARNTVTTCVNTMVGTAAIGINPSPVSFSVTGGGNICPGGTGVHIGISNSTVGVNYQLFNGSIAAAIAIPGTGSSIDFGLQSAVGIYNVVATNQATSCSINMSGSASVTISALPAMHTVTGGGSFCIGDAGVNVGLNGSNTGTNYQLFIGGAATGALIPGSGSALNFGLQLIAGVYTVVATNAAIGCTNNMAGIATVIVSNHPTNYYITGGGGYCAGVGGLIGVHIGLSGSDPGINYQLYNGAIAVITMGGTGHAIDFGLQTSLGTYSVVAASASTTCTGNMAGTTNVFLTAPPSAYIVTGGGSYCSQAGAGVNIGLNGSNTGVTYYLYNSGIAMGAGIPGTSLPLDFGSQTSGHYTIVATSGSVCSNNMIGEATVIAEPMPAVHTVTGGGNYCTGGAGVHLLLNGSETGINYQLFAGVLPIGTIMHGNGLPLDFGLQTIAETYTVRATNSSTTCASNMTGSATITLAPLPIPYNVNGGGTYCSSGPGLPVSLGGSASGVTYQLYNGSTPEGAPLYGNGSPIDFGLQTLIGTYTVTATNTATGCSSTMPGGATIATYPVSVEYSITGGGNYCTGGTGVNIALNGSAPGLSFQLLNGVAIVGSPIAGTGSVIDFGLQTAAGSYTVVATNNATGCTGTMTGSVSIAISSLPLIYYINSSGTSYCAGGMGIGVNLNNSQAGVNYQLYRGTTPIGSPVSGTMAGLAFGTQTIAGTYTVAGVDAVSGCVSHMTGSASVNINPLPVAYNVTGGGGYCADATGAPIGLSNSNAGILYQLYHSGTPAGLQLTGTGAAIDMGLYSATGSYVITATNPATGCARNMAGTATISIKPSPATYTTTGGGSFCMGGAGVHIGLSGSVTGVNYQLLSGIAPAGVAVSGTGGSLDFGLQAMPGTYTVKAIITSTGCTGNMAGAVNVANLALPSAHSISGGGSYCSGGTGLPIRTIGSNSGIRYTLYNGATITGIPITGTGFDINFGTQTTPGTYTVVAADPTTSCISYMPGSASIMVNPLPNKYIISGGGSYCTGGTGMMIGLNSSDNGVTYTLLKGTSTNGTLIGTGSPVNFGLQRNIGTYLIVAGNVATGCTDYMLGNAVIDIIPVVNPTVSIIKSIGDTVCSGDLINFTANATDGGLTPSYQWTVNGSVKSAAVSYSYIPDNGDIVAVSLTSSASCAIPAIVNSSAAITVDLKQLAAINISANPGIEVCTGTAVSFTALPSYGGRTPIFEWIKNGQSMGTNSVYVYIPQQGDVISCKMTSNYQCRIANSVLSIPVGITVDSPLAPVVAISAYPGLNLSPGQAVTMVAKAINGTPVATYQWLVNGILASGATTPTFTSSNLTDGDILTCDVVSGGGCSGIPGSSSVTVHVSNVGVHVISASGSGLEVSPNPMKGTFHVKGIIGDATGEVIIEINDMIGHVVYNSKLMCQNGELNERIQLSNTLPNGMYLLNLRYNEGSKVLRIVLEQ
jgi:hypothetical protein